MSGSVFDKSGGAFTVWMDPARWPVPKLKLFGRATSVWLNPDRWPKSPLRLSGAAFTVWLDPATWPKSAPSNIGATLSKEKLLFDQKVGLDDDRVESGPFSDVPINDISNTERDPRTLGVPSHLAYKMETMRRRFSSPGGAPRQPIAGALFSALPAAPPKPLESDSVTINPVAGSEALHGTSEAAPVPLETTPASENTNPENPAPKVSLVAETDPVKTDTRPIISPAESTSPAPGPASLREMPVSLQPPAPVAAPATAPIIINKSRAFSIWTNQAVAATSVITTRAVLKLPGKAFTLWTKPALIAPIPMRNGMTAAELENSTRKAAVVQPAIRPAVSTSPPPSAANHWLPLAAAFAIVGLAGLKMAADTSRLEASQSENLVLRAQLSVSGSNTSAVASPAALEKAPATPLPAAPVATATTDSEAKLMALSEQNAKVTADFNTAKTAAEKERNTAAEKAAAFAKLSEELAAAKKEAAARDNATQSQIITITEDAAKIKRAAAAEVVTLRESLGKLQAEKAAALKDAATAAQEKAALQAALDALKNRLPKRL